jgi:hypothetical protein
MASTVPRRRAAFHASAPRPVRWPRPIRVASVARHVVEPGSPAQVIATAPEFVWELSLGIYLMVKRLKPSPILREGTAAGRYVEP